MRIEYQARRGRPQVVIGLGDGTQVIYPPAPVTRCSCGQAIVRLAEAWPPALRDRPFVATALRWLHDRHGLAAAVLVRGPDGRGLLLCERCWAATSPAMRRARQLRRAAGQPAREVVKLAGPGVERMSV